MCQIYQIHPGITAAQCRREADREHARAAAEMAFEGHNPPTELYQILTAFADTMRIVRDQQRRGEAFVGMSELELTDFAMLQFEEVLRALPAPEIDTPFVDRIDSNPGAEHAR